MVPCDTISRRRRTRPLACALPTTDPVNNISQPIQPRTDLPYCASLPSVGQFALRHIFIINYRTAPGDAISMLKTVFVALVGATACVLTSGLSPESASHRLPHDIRSPDTVASDLDPSSPITIFEALTTEVGPYPCIRIPSTLALPDGSVLAFAECRRWVGDGCFIDGMKNDSSAEYFNRSICMRKSVDGGATWGALQDNITERYSANPSAVFDQVRNRTLLVFNDAASEVLYSVSSSDGGSTWDLPAKPLLDSQTAEPMPGVGGPGNSVVALPDGTLLAAVYVQHERNTLHGHSTGVGNAMSTDDVRSDCLSVCVLCIYCCGMLQIPYQQDEPEPNRLLFKRECYTKHGRWRDLGAGAPAPTFG